MKYLQQDWEPSRLDTETSRKLLAAVFPNSRKFATPEYLKWLYESNPRGAAFTLDACIPTLESISHYAALPQIWRQGNKTLDFALSVNSATAAERRGQGIFAKLGNSLYAQAKADRPKLSAFLGVPNREALPPRVKRLGWQPIEMLDLKICFLPNFGNSQSLACRFNAGSADAKSILSNIDFDVRNDGCWSQVWDAGYLLWRLSNPLETYFLHQLGSITAIVNVKQVKGLKIAVVVKLFTGRSADDSEVRAIWRDIARFHRLAFVVHAGISRILKIPGWTLPEKLRRSPLTLAGLSLASGVAIDAAFMVDRFEFFDFDIL